MSRHTRPPRPRRPLPVHMPVLEVVGDRPMPYAVSATGEEPSGKRRPVRWYFATAEDRERAFPTRRT